MKEETTKTIALNYVEVVTAIKEYVENRTKWCPDNVKIIIGDGKNKSDICRVSLPPTAECLGAITSTTKGN